MASRVAGAISPDELMRGKLPLSRCNAELNHFGLSNLMIADDVSGKQILPQTWGAGGLRAWAA